jgi:hypothetical protein
MAEPIRKTALPSHRRPPGVRPHPRPRPVPLRTLQPVPPAAAPPPNEPEQLPEPLESVRTRTRTSPPIRHKKLRSVLQAALGLHLAALLLPLLASSAGPVPALPDALLASAVLLAGGAVLGFGTLRR